MLAAYLAAACDSPDPSTPTRMRFMMFSVRARARRPPWSNPFGGGENAAQLFEHAKDAAVVGLHVPAGSGELGARARPETGHEEYLADALGLHLPYRALAQRSETWAIARQGGELAAQILQRGAKAARRARHCRMQGRRLDHCFCHPRRGPSSATPAKPSRR